MRRAWRSASGAGALLLACAAPGAAGLVPGGGAPTSDCYAELDVAGVENGTEHVMRNKKVMCVDGDPCDAGPCGDGVCDLQVRLCWNQRDPHVPACVPPPMLEELHLRGPLSALVLMPRSLGGTTCGESYTPFGVATKGGKRPGRMNVRLTAMAPEGTTPRIDTDLIRLVCVPRPFEECTMPPTTSTTSVPTTTLVGATTSTVTSSTTTTTRRRRKTTTTSTRPPTTTTSTPPTSTFVPTTSSTLTPTTSTLLPTTLPTTLLPTTLLPTTLAPTTTTPTTTAPTTTTREEDDKRGHRG